MTSSSLAARIFDREIVPLARQYAAAPLADQGLYRQLVESYVHVAYQAVALGTQWPDCELTIVAQLREVSAYALIAADPSHHRLPSRSVRAATLHGLESLTADSAPPIGEALEQMTFRVIAAGRVGRRDDTESERDPDLDDARPPTAFVGVIQAGIATLASMRRVAVAKRRQPPGELAFDDVTAKLCEALVLELGAEDRLGGRSPLEAAKQALRRREAKDRTGRWSPADATP